METGSQRRLLPGDVKSKDMLSAPYYKIMLSLLGSEVIMPLPDSLRDVGSTRHADIQPSTVAMILKLQFLSVLGDLYFLPVAGKQEQYNLLACK